MIRDEPEADRTHGDQETAEYSEIEADERDPGRERDDTKLLGLREYDLIGNPETGDLASIEDSGLGVLRNPVISWRDAHGEPPPERVRW